MPHTRLIRRLTLLAACLWLPLDADAGYDQAFLTITPSADTPSFTWTHSEAPATPPAEQASRPSLDQSAQPDQTDTAAPVTGDRPSSLVAAWHSYIDRFIIPSLRTALSTRLTQPLPLPMFPVNADSTALPDDPGEPADAQTNSPEPFIKIVIPLASASSDPPMAMHVQILLPEDTFFLILREATATASASETTPSDAVSSDRIQRTRSFEAYLDNLSDTLKEEASVQQYFRTTTTTSMMLSVTAALAEIIALGTLPLHAVFTTIPMLVYYIVSEALGEDPLDRHWKLFSSTSNSLLRTTFSDTLIPVP